MDLSQFQDIDPHLLLGLVNTELRNHSDSLQDLCQTHDIDLDALCARLKSVNYHYLLEQKQFR